MSANPNTYTVPPLCVTHFPARIVRVVDGDTLDIQPRWSVHHYRIRLLAEDGGCWAPESRGVTRELGQAASAAMSRLIEANPGVCSVFIPILEEMDNPVEILVTLGRTLGRVYMGHVNLGEELVRMGPAFATRTRDERKDFDAAWIQRQLK